MDSRPHRLTNSSLGVGAQRSFTDPDPQLAAGIVIYQVKAVRGELESDRTNEISFDIAGGPGMGVVGIITSAPTTLPDSKAA